MGLFANDKVKVKYYGDEIKEEISKITGFNPKKIILLRSKRYDDNSTTLDYHQFSYDNKIYAIKRGILISLDK